MLKLNEQLKFRCENDGKYIYWDLKCLYTSMIAISKPFVPLKSFLQIQKAVKQPQQTCKNTMHTHFSRGGGQGFWKDVDSTTFS